MSVTVGNESLGGRRYGETTHICDNAMIFLNKINDSEAGCENCCIEYKRFQIESGLLYQIQATRGDVSHGGQ